MAGEEAQQQQAEQPKEVPEQTKQEEPKQNGAAAAAATHEEPKQEQPKQEQPKQEEPKTEEPKQEQPKAEEPKPEPVPEQPKQEEKPQQQQQQQAPIKVAFYSCKEYDSESFQEATAAYAGGHTVQYTFLGPRLEKSTVSLAAGHHAVCLFVNDDASAEILEQLAKLGIKAVAMRCAGTNNVDLKKAEELGLKVSSVPSYSPHAVAEFTIGLMLTATRKIHKAYNRTREGDFTLTGLVGFNLFEKTVGLIGSGRIGLLTGRILSKGMCCKVIAYDPYPNPKAAEEHGVTYVDTLEELLKQSDVLSLHCPLMDSTYHVLNDKTLALTKPGVVIVNSSRGGLIDTEALIRSLKSGQVKAVAVDVYEGESQYFFNDTRNSVMQDDVLARLMSFHNVFVSGHQAFLTEEALHNIAASSIKSITENAAH